MRRLYPQPVPRPERRIRERLLDRAILVTGAVFRPAACLLIVTLTACDPVVTIAGANFPSWLFCLIVGAILAALTRPLLGLSRLEPYLGPLTIFYPSLIAMFAMIVWVIFFNRV